MKYTEIGLPDNFEVGDCSNCPFEYYDEGGEPLCVLKKDLSKCDLKVKITKSKKKKPKLDDVCYMCLYFMGDKTYNYGNCKCKDFMKVKPNQDACECYRNATEFFKRMNKKHR